MNPAACARAVRSHKRYVAREKKEMLRTRRALLGFQDEDEDLVVEEPFPMVFAWERQRQIVAVNGDDDLHMEQDDEALVVEQDPVAADNTGLAVNPALVLEALVVVAPNVEAHNEDLVVLAPNVEAYNEGLVVNVEEQYEGLEVVAPNVEEHNEGLVAVAPNVEEHKEGLVEVAPNVEEHAQIETGVVAPNIEGKEVVTPLVEPKAEISFETGVVTPKMEEKKVATPLVEPKAEIDFETETFDSSLSLSTCLACIDKIKAERVSPIFYVSCICEKSFVPCIPSPEAVVEVLLFLIQDLQNKPSLSKEGDKLELKAKYSFDTEDFDCSRSLSICPGCINLIKNATVSPTFSISCMCKQSLVRYIPSPGKEDEFKVSAFLIEDLQNKLDYLRGDHEDS